MYFLSNLFQGIKKTLCALGLLSSSGIIIYGAVTVAGGTVLGWVAIGCGIACFIPSCFGVFESTKLLNDIKKEVENFKQQIKIFGDENEKFKLENETFKQNVESLEKTKQDIMQENTKLAVLADRQEQQAKNFDDLRQQYEVQVDKFKEQADTIDAQNKELLVENSALKETVRNIENLKEQLKTQNTSYQQSLERMKAHVDTIEQLKDQYLEQNDKFKSNIEDQKQQILQLTALSQDQQNQLLQLKHALDKSEEQAAALKTLVIQLRELYRNLALAGDAFKSFQETIGEDVSKLDTSAHNIESQVENMTNLMLKLNTKLLTSDFLRMDKNHDGRVTKDEFVEFMEDDQTYNVNDDPLDTNKDTNKSREVQIHDKIQQIPHSPASPITTRDITIEIPTESPETSQFASQSTSPETSSDTSDPLSNIDL